MHAWLDTLSLEEEEFECSKLSRVAVRLDLDEPPYTDKEMWEKVGTFWLLTPKGRLTLRRAIDEERTRRREVAAWWWKTVIIPALAAGTGVIGALTGLLAVSHHK